MTIDPSIFQTYNVQSFEIVGYSSSGSSNAYNYTGANNYLNNQIFVDDIAINFGTDTPEPSTLLLVGGGLALLGSKKVFRRRI